MRRAPATLLFCFKFIYRRGGDPNDMFENSFWSKNTAGTERRNHLVDVVDKIKMKGERKSIVL